MPEIIRGFENVTAFNKEKDSDRVVSDAERCRNVAISLIDAEKAKEKRTLVIRPDFVNLHCNELK